MKLDTACEPMWISPVGKPYRTRRSLLRYPRGLVSRSSDGNQAPFAYDGLPFTRSPPLPR